MSVFHLCVPFPSAPSNLLFSFIDLHMWMKSFNSAYLRYNLYRTKHTQLKYTFWWGLTKQCTCIIIIIIKEQNSSSTLRSALRLFPIKPSPLAPGNYWSAFCHYRLGMSFLVMKEVLTYVFLSLDSDSLIVSIRFLSCKQRKITLADFSSKGICWENTDSRIAGRLENQLWDYAASNKAPNHRVQLF